MKNKKKAASRWFKPLFTCSVTLACTVLLGNPVFSQSIITDGNTATTLNTSGNVTNITTGTIQNNNAFNSFSRFNVDSGKTVNLVVPNSANNLINIVTGEKSSINGVLNSFQNGQLGGNVFFANPYGVVVGSTGSINVGRLNMSTPTQSFVNNFFTSPGNPNPASVNALLNNTEPINCKASITNNGAINMVAEGTFTSKKFTNAGSIFSAGRGTFGTPISIIADIVNLDSNSSINNASSGPGRVGIVSINRLSNGNVEIVNSKNPKSPALQLTPEELRTVGANDLIVGGVTTTRDLLVKADIERVGTLEFFARNNINILRNISITPAGGFASGRFVATAGNKLNVHPFVNISATGIELGGKNVCIGHDAVINSAETLGIRTGTTNDINIGNRSKLSGEFVVISSNGNINVGKEAQISSLGGLFISTEPPSRYKPSGNITIGKNAIITGGMNISSSNLLSVNNGAILGTDGDITLFGKNGICIFPDAKLNAGNDISLTSQRIIKIFPFATLNANNDIILTAKTINISPQADLNANGEVIIND